MKFYVDLSTHSYIYGCSKLTFLGIFLQWLKVYKDSLPSSRTVVRWVTEFMVVVVQVNSSHVLDVDCEGLPKSALTTEIMAKIQDMVLKAWVLERWVKLGFITIILNQNKMLRSGVNPVLRL